MTGKDTVFIDMIEFALDWGFCPSAKQMNKYHELIERRILDDLHSKKTKIRKQAKDC
jgi:hypothetical protein